MSPKEILDQANELARLLYEIRGYTVQEGYKFHEATHPHEREAWEGARVAMELLIDTDPEDAISDLDEQEDG